MKIRTVEYCMVFCSSRYLCRTFLPGYPSLLPRKENGEGGGDVEIAKERKSTVGGVATFSWPSAPMIAQCFIGSIG